MFARMIMFVLGGSICTLHLCFECFCVPSPYMNVIILIKKKKMNVIILRCLELLGLIGYVIVISWCPFFLVQCMSDPPDL